MCKLLNFTNHQLEDLSKTGIYSITNLVNGRFYIGSATKVNKFDSNSGFYARWLDHLSSLGRGCHDNIHLQRAWEKYGSENFRFEILEFVEPEHCIEVEQFYLDLLVKDLRVFVYNICFVAGSCKGRVTSQETRDKLSKRSEKQYLLFSPEGELFEGKNLSAFASSKGFLPSQLYRVLNGGLFHYKGWTNSLENYEVYKKAHKLRGLHFFKATGGWQVTHPKKYKAETKSKYFKDLKDALLYRDKIVSKGFEFNVVIKDRSI